MTTINGVNLGLSGATGTGNFVGANTPTLITPVLGVASATSLTLSSTTGIVGTTTNNNAATGSVGEYVNADLQYNASPIALSNNVGANIVSISLTAGDWDVFGLVGLNIAPTTVMVYVNGGASTISAAPPSNSNYAFYLTPLPASSTVYNGLSFPIPQYRLSLSGTTTVYLIVVASFGVSTCSAFGYLSARRAR